jgi:hypothetical protein
LRAPSRLVKNNFNRYRRIETWLDSAGSSII